MNGALNSVIYGHDPVAAENLVEYFYERIGSGEPYNERILQAYLLHAFGKIVRDKWTADHAFGFKLKRGKHERDDTTERDFAAAAYVVLKMRNNTKWEVAIGDAANLLFPDGTGDKAVKNAHSFYKDALCVLPDIALSKICESLLPSYHPI